MLKPILALLLLTSLLTACGEKPAQGEHYDVNKPYIDAEKRAKAALEQANQQSQTQLDHALHDDTQATQSQP